ncbi:unnamed protein product [Schistocephalus solidus]|uniref:Uncharacterized protein n=1 Tax=Schistocephalus solidus TaxID=70667 RepID=A0A183TG61_SCHSO|nr:unnamed protein product [Schistocephalus solidus]
MASITASAEEVIACPLLVYPTVLATLLSLVVSIASVFTKDGSFMHTIPGATDRNEERYKSLFKVDIAALSETQFSEQGQLEEVGAGYTFFWSGRPKAEGCDAGVTFAIRNDIMGHLPCLPQGINDDNNAAINVLLTDKNRLHRAYIDRPTTANKTAFYRSRHLVQQWLQEIQDAWMTSKAEEIQGFADRNEWKNIFAATKTVYGPPV